MIMTGYDAPPVFPSGDQNPLRLKFSMAIGGDGGWVVYDPRDAAHFYGSVQHFHIYRKRVGRRLEEVTPRGLTAAEREVTWMAFIEMDPEDSKIVFAGSTRVWRTLNDGCSWQVSPYLDGSPISAIEIARCNRRRIYVGTQNGGFFRSMDGGDTWSRNMAGPELPGRIITRIEAHPTNEEEVYLTVGSHTKAPKDKQFSRVFRSDNGGERWTSAATVRQLPDVPHLALAFETVKPYRIFVAGDTSVHMGRKLKSDKYKWVPFVEGLPSVVVTDLVYHESTQMLVASTYGRGVWATRLG
jgi:hypothetical protein